MGASRLRVKHNLEDKFSIQCVKFTTNKNTGLTNRKFIWCEISCADSGGYKKYLVFNLKEGYKIYHRSIRHLVSDCTPSRDIRLLLWFVFSASSHVDIFAELQDACFCCHMNVLCPSLSAEWLKPVQRHATAWTVGRPNTSALCKCYWLSYPRVERAERGVDQPNPSRAKDREYFYYPFLGPSWPDLGLTLCLISVWHNLNSAKQIKVTIYSSGFYSKQWTFWSFIKPWKI